MAFTVADVVAEVQDHLKGFYLATDARTVPLVNKAHRRIVQRLHLYQENVWPVPLTGGVGLYELDSTVYRIHAADYLTAPNVQGISLRETSIDWLDHRAKGWRTAPPSTPSRYYRDGAKLGLYPAPILTSTLAFPYPSVSVAGLGWHDLTALTDVLPALLPTTDPYVWEVCSRWCLENQPGDAKGFGDLASIALGEAKRTIDQALIRQAPQVVANIPRIRRGR